MTVQNLVPVVLNNDLGFALENLTKAQLTFDRGQNAVEKARILNSFNLSHVILGRVNDWLILNVAVQMGKSSVGPSFVRKITGVPRLTGLTRLKPNLTVSSINN